MAVPTREARPSGIVGSGASVNFAADLSLQGIQVDDVMVIGVLQDGTGTDLTLSSINSRFANLAGTTSAATHVATVNVGSPAAAKLHCWIVRIADVTSGSATITVNSSSGDDMYGLWVAYRGVSTGTTLADVIENGSAGATATGAGTSTTIADAGVTTLGADRLAINLVGVNDDNAVVSFTSETGGDWTEDAGGEEASATGTDGCIQIQTASMASAGTINGGTQTMGASDGWGVLGFALIPTDGAVTVPITNVGAISLAGLAPTIRHRPTPGTGAVSVAGLAPTARIRPTPGVGAISVQGHNLGRQSVFPGTGAISVAGLAPPARVRATPGTGAVSLAGLAPTARVRATPGLGAVSLQGHAPTIESGGGEVVVPIDNVGEIDLAGLSATARVRATPGVGAVSLAGLAPTTRVRSTPGTGVISLAGLAPSPGIITTPGLGAIALAGLSATPRIRSTPGSTNIALQGLTATFTPEGEATARTRTLLGVGT